MAKKRLIQQPENEKVDSLFVRIAIPNCSANDTVIVEESNNAIVIKNGQLLQSLNPGKHQLVKYGMSKELYEVVFFPKTSKIKMLWGTKEQFSLRDPLEDVVLRVGANGEIDVQIISPRKFFLELGNKKDNFTINDLKESMQAKLLTYLEEFISKYMTQNKISYDSLEEKKNLVANEIRPYVSSKIENDFGLKIASLTINGVIIPNQYINELVKARENRLELTDKNIVKKAQEEEKQERNQKIAIEVANQMLDEEKQSLPKNENNEKQEDEMLLL